MCSLSGLTEARQALASLGLYREFPLPGGVGVDMQPWIRQECAVVWEVGLCLVWFMNDAS